MERQASSLPRFLSVIVLGILSIVCFSGSIANAAFLGPTPYLSFNDSPFTGMSFSYFYLEDFEDHQFNVPGVTASGVSLMINSNGYYGPALWDSVDADDGIINGMNNDGKGHYGDSLWGNGQPGVTFTFDAKVLGALPTHVGIVWTDGANPIVFEAFDQNGVSLGIITDNHADGSVTGQTGEDRFYGVINAGGISSFRISDNAGIEVDHLQYGIATSPVPIPSSLFLLGSGLAGLLGLVRKRRS